MVLIKKEEIVSFFQTVIEKYNELAIAKYENDLDSFPVESKSIESLMRQIADLRENQAKFSTDKVNAIINSSRTIVIKLDRFVNSLSRLEVNLNNKTNMVKDQMSKLKLKVQKYNEETQDLKSSSYTTPARIQQLENRIGRANNQKNKIELKINELKLMCHFSNEVGNSLKLLYTE